MAGTLPADVQERVMARLDGTTLARAVAVSKQWQKAACSDKLWKALAQLDFPGLIGLESALPSSSSAVWRTLYGQRAGLVTYARPARHRPSDFLLMVEVTAQRTRAVIEAEAAPWSSHIHGASAWLRDPDGDKWVAYAGVIELDDIYPEGGENDGVHVPQDAQNPVNLAVASNGEYQLPHLCLELTLVRKSDQKMMLLTDRDTCNCDRSYSDEWFPLRPIRDHSSFQREVPNLLLDFVIDDGIRHRDIHGDQPSCPLAPEGTVRYTHTIKRLWMTVTEGSEALFASDDEQASAVLETLVHYGHWC